MWFFRFKSDGHFGIFSAKASSTNLAYLFTSFTTAFCVICPISTLDPFSNGRRFYSIFGTSGMRRFNRFDVFTWAYRYNTVAILRGNRAACQLLAVLLLVCPCVNLLRLLIMRRMIGRTFNSVERVAVAGCETIWLEMFWSFLLDNCSDGAFSSAFRVGCIWGAWDCRGSWQSRPIA